MKSELFGTMFRPNARWACPVCKRKNVTALRPPLRESERLYCAGCHKLTIITLDMSTVPSFWGGRA